MKIIKLHRLTLENFKCHGHLVVEPLGADLSIYGDNATGKTSIYDGLCWLLFGRDSRGNGEKTMELKPLNRQGLVRDHKAITSVEAQLEVDGERIVLKRSLRENWSVKRGQSQPSFEGNECTYSVDGIPMKRTEFERRVAALVPEEVFRLLTSVSYFSAELDWRSRRRMLFELAGIPADDALLAGEERFAPLAQAMGKRSLEELSKRLNARRKTLLGVRSDTPARLSEEEKLLRQLGIVDYGAVQQERDRLAQGLEDLERRLREIPGEASAEAARRAIRQRDQWKLDLQQAERDAANARRQEELCRADWETAKAERFRGGCCPTCGQPLPPEQLERAQKRFEDQRQQRMDRAMASAENCRILKENAQNRVAELARRLEALEQQNLRAMPEQPEREALEREIQESRAAIAAKDSILAQQGIADFARRRMAQLRQEDEAAGQELAQIEGLQALMEEFIRYKASYIEAAVNGMFLMAKFRLFRPQANGGLEERCDVTYQGIPYSCLNNGARINVGVDIIRTLSHSYGYCVPLVVDNAESVTELGTAPGQLIRLCVSGGALRFLR